MVLPISIKHKKSSQAVAHSLMLAGPLSSDRQSIEQFVFDKYFQSHQAEVSHFMPALLAIYRNSETDGKSISAAVGLQFGEQGPMYLEQYLARPVEQEIADYIKGPVLRSSLCEIGNLAISDRPSGLLLFLLMTCTLAELGTRWMCFTATPKVKKLIEGLGYSPVQVATASEINVNNDSKWGSYYQHSPYVMLVDIEQAMKKLDSNEFLSNLIKPYMEQQAAVVELLSQIDKQI